MCNQDSLNWIQENLSPEEVREKCILEVGSYDINGSMRTVIEQLGALEYTGSDMRAGPGVDLVCRAEHLVRHFGQQRFDIVVSSSTLEHVRHWREAISNIKRLCKPGGLILIITPSRWPFHPHPWDYWRFYPSDFEQIFADCEIQTLHEELSPRALVYARIRKPVDFVEHDLSGYHLTSIITGERVERFRAGDIASWHFLKVLAGCLAETVRRTYIRFYMRWLETSWAHSVRSLFHR